MSFMDLAISLNSPPDSSVPTLLSCRWAWLIYAGVVLCCICPMLFFFFKWRRDKEAELDNYSGPGESKIQS